MITAKEANYISKYGNPQKELVDIAVKKLIDYIDKKTILTAQEGEFEDSATFVLGNPPFYHYLLPDKLTKRSIKEVIEKVAEILEEQGYDIYYEDDYIRWSWKLNE